METQFEMIMRKTGRKPVQCKCKLCKTQCRTPCLGTPEDLLKIIGAGYKDRVVGTWWKAGMVAGVIDYPVPMIQPLYDAQKQACTFFTDGLCELHEAGLKPTEGKLSHHSTSADNFNIKKSLAWNVAKTWLKLSNEEAQQLVDKYIQPNL